MEDQDVLLNAADVNATSISEMPSGPLASEGDPQSDSDHVARLELWNAINHFHYYYECLQQIVPDVTKSYHDVALSVSHHLDEMRPMVNHLAEESAVASQAATHAFLPKDEWFSGKSSLDELKGRLIRAELSADKLASVVRQLCSGLDKVRSCLPSSRKVDKWSYDIAQRLMEVNNNRRRQELSPILAPGSISSEQNISCVDNVGQQEERDQP
jgi:hypothetical protein